jgi:hypothetical protein
MGEGGVAALRDGAGSAIALMVSPALRAETQSREERCLGDARYAGNEYRGEKPVEQAHRATTLQP